RGTRNAELGKTMAKMKCASRRASHRRGELDNSADRLSPELKTGAVCVDQLVGVAGGGSEEPVHGGRPHAGAGTRSHRDVVHDAIDSPCALNGGEECLFFLLRPHLAGHAYDAIFDREMHRHLSSGSHTQL